MAWHKGSFAPRCRPLLVRVVSGRDDGYVAKHEESDQRRFLHPHQSRRGPRRQILGRDNFSTFHDKVIER